MSGWAVEVYRYSDGKKVSEDRVRVLDGVEQVASVYGFSTKIQRERAALIVAAVNAHDDLIALAMAVAKDYEDAADWKDANGRLQSMARAALVKAGVTR